MLHCIERLRIRFARVLDQRVEREADISGRGQEPAANVPIHVDVLRDRYVRIDNQLFFDPQIAASRRMDVEHQNHRGRSGELELNVETDLDYHPSVFPKSAVMSTVSATAMRISRNCISPSGSDMSGKVVPLSRCK